MAGIFGGIADPIVVTKGKGPWIRANNSLL